MSVVSGILTLQYRPRLAATPTFRSRASSSTLLCTTGQFRDTPFQLSTGFLLDGGRQPLAQLTDRQGTPGWGGAGPLPFMFLLCGDDAAPVVPTPPPTLAQMQRNLPNLQRYFGAVSATGLTREAKLDLIASTFAADAVLIKRRDGDPERKFSGHDGIKAFYGSDASPVMKLPDFKPRPSSEWTDRRLAAGRRKCACLTLALRVFCMCVCLPVAGGCVACMLMQFHHAIASCGLQQLRAGRCRTHCPGRCKALHIYFALLLACTCMGTCPGLLDGQATSPPPFPATAAPGSARPPPLPRHPATLQRKPWRSAWTATRLRSRSSCPSEAARTARAGGWPQGWCGSGTFSPLTQAGSSAASWSTDQ